MRVILRPVITNVIAMKYRILGSSKFDCFKNYDVVSKKTDKIILGIHTQELKRYSVKKLISQCDLAIASRPVSRKLELFIHSLEVMMTGLKIAPHIAFEYNSLTDDMELVLSNNKDFENDYESNIAIRGVGKFDEFKISYKLKNFKLLHLAYRYIEAIESLKLKEDVEVALCKSRVIRNKDSIIRDLTRRFNILKLITEYDVCGGYDGKGERVDARSELEGVN